MSLMMELLTLLLLKWYTVPIRTWLGIHGQIYPFAFRSSLGLSPRELLQTKGYIWPYIPPLILIRIQYITQFHYINIYRWPRARAGVNIWPSLASCVYTNKQTTNSPTKTAKARELFPPHDCTPDAPGIWKVSTLLTGRGSYCHIKVF